MVILATKTRVSLSNPEKLVVKAAVRLHCEDVNAARRIIRAIENPSRETNRVILSDGDERVLLSTLNCAATRIRNESEGRGQLTYQALQDVIARIALK